MTVAAKAIIGSYYGNAPKYSYWNGCSTGGRQALTEAQRYPNDYDGILAGAPAIYASRLQGMQVWASQTVHKDEASYIPPSKYPMLHDAVLQQCDALDGVKDGVLEDPTKCKFDPKVLACKESDAASCLTVPQVGCGETLRWSRIPEQARRFLSGLQPGRVGWNMLAGPQPIACGRCVPRVQRSQVDRTSIRYGFRSKAIADSMDATNQI
jgi:feruloyl esterase